MTYGGIMFSIYLIGAIAMLVLNVYFEWSWRREFGEPLGAEAKWMGWGAFYLISTVAFGWWWAI